MFLSEILTLTFLILVKSCFQESIFINSVHDVVNYNSECHIHLLLQAPFYFTIVLKNPLTIRLLDESKIQNEDSLLQDNSTISIENVRGINCIYFIFLQPYKQTNLTAGLQNLDTNYYKPVSIPLFNIAGMFFGIKDRLDGSDIFVSITEKISHMIIFTRLISIELPPFVYLFLETKTHVSNKIGFVLLSDSDFEEKNSNASKSITHLICRPCVSEPLHTLSDTIFNLRYLKNFLDHFKTVNERHFQILTSSKIVQALMTLPNTKEMHPMVASKHLTKSLASSSTLREILDYFMLLNLIDYHNLSVDIGGFGMTSKKTELLPSYGELFIIDIDNVYLEARELLLVEVTSHSFLTCYNVPIVSIAFFVSPFDPIVWILFTCSAVAITLTWYKIGQLSKKGTTKSFSPTLFMISSITDDSCGTPNWIGKQVAFRISFVAWFLAVIVIVNGYISVLISDLTTPFDMKTIRFFQNLTVPYYNYQDIRIKNHLWCFMGCGPSSVYYDDYVHTCPEEINTENLTPRQFDEERDFRILSTAFDNTREQQTRDLGTDSLDVGCNHTRMQWHTSSFMSNLIKFQQKSCMFDPFQDIGYSQSVSMFEDLLFNLIFPSHNGMPQSAANLFLLDPIENSCELKNNIQFDLEIETELLKCGKVVFADEHRVVLLEYEYLKKQYRNVSFFLSEQIWPQQRYWKFDAMFTRPIMLEGVKTLLSNGIYFRTLEYFQASKYFERARVHREKNLQENDTLKPTVLVLAGKFKSLFLVFLSLFFIFILVALLENIFKKMSWNTREIKRKICLMIYLLQHLQYIYFRQIITLITRLKFESMFCTT